MHATNPNPYDFERWLADEVRQRPLPEAIEHLATAAMARGESRLRLQSPQIAVLRRQRMQTALFNTLCGLVLVGLIIVVAMRFWQRQAASAASAETDYAAISTDNSPTGMASSSAPQIIAVSACTIGFIVLLLTIEQALSAGDSWIPLLRTSVSGADR
jgi:hypothetical protein